MRKPSPSRSRTPKGPPLAVVVTGAKLRELTTEKRGDRMRRSNETSLVRFDQLFQGPRVYLIISL